MTVDVVIKAVEAGEVDEKFGMTFIMKEFNELKNQASEADE